MEEKKCFKAFQTYNLTLSTARDVKKYMKQKKVFVLEKDKVPLLGPDIEGLAHLSVSEL